MSLEQEAERGRMAEEVLNNPVYVEAYAQIEQGITESWRQSKDAQEREQLHQLLRMVDKARNVVETAMREGRIAKDKLTQRRSVPQRIGDRLRAY